MVKGLSHPYSLECNHSTLAASCILVKSQSMSSLAVVKSMVSTGGTEPHPDFKGRPSQVACLASEWSRLTCCCSSLEHRGGFHRMKHGESPALPHCDPGEDPMVPCNPVWLPTGTQQPSLLLPLKLPPDHTEDISSCRSRHSAHQSLPWQVVLFLCSAQ